MNKDRNHYIQEAQLLQTLTTQTIRVKPNKDAIKDKQKAVKNKKKHTNTNETDDFSTVKRKALKKVSHMRQENNPQL